MNALIKIPHATFLGVLSKFPHKTRQHKFSTQNINERIIQLRHRPRSLTHTTSASPIYYAIHKSAKCVRLSYIYIVTLARMKCVCLLLFHHRSPSWDDAALCLRISLMVSFSIYCVHVKSGHEHTICVVYAKCQECLAAAAAPAAASWNPGNNGHYSSHAGRTAVPATKQTNIKENGGWGWWEVGVGGVGSYISTRRTTRTASSCKERNDIRTATKGRNH